MEWTHEEENALNMKLNHPDVTVVCPRCGKELQYKGYGSAWRVWCPTGGCIRITLRGI